MLLRNGLTSHTTTIDVGPTTENRCEGNNYDKQSEKQKNFL